MRELEDKPGFYYALIGDGSDDVWACGQTGLVAKFDFSAGSSSVQTTPTSQHLFDISSSGTNKLVAVGMLKQLFILRTVGQIGLLLLFMEVRLIDFFV